MSDNQTVGQVGQVTGANRIVIASANVTSAAWPTAHGLFFSDAFWAALRMGHSLQESFVLSRARVNAAGCVLAERTLCQEPWLDDNGAGMPNTSLNGVLASGWSLPTPDYRSPQIVNLTTTPAQNNQSVFITADILYGAQLQTVEARLRPPDGQPAWPPDAAFAALDPTVVPLYRAPPTPEQRTNVVTYLGLYTPTVASGTIVTVYGWDGQNLPILPRSVPVENRKLYLPIIQK